MRMPIAALCICLSACSVGSLVEVAGTQQTNEPEEGETCAKFKDLKIGMTPSQVLSACARSPLRTSDVITREAKKVTTWAYKGSYLHFADGKLETIQSLE